MTKDRLRVLDYLEHMLQAIRRISRYTQDMRTLPRALGRCIFDAQPGWPWLFLGRFFETPPGPPLIQAWDLGPGEASVLAYAYAVLVLGEWVVERKG